MIDDAAEKVAVVPEVQLDLHCGDVSNPPRFLELADRDVAEADAVNHSAAFEGR